MIEKVTLKVTPAIAKDEKALRKLASSSLHIQEDDINDVRIVKRSIDARKRDIVINLTLNVAVGEDKSAIPKPVIVDFSDITDDAERLVIVGAGPAGLFAGLRAIELGYKPIILERGKDVDSRRLDIAQMNRSGEINPVSNYCFGEGGAGTFSDGKLFTRSKKRGDNDAIMHLLVQFGAKPEILADSHPHIGSDRLPGIIKRIREKIIECGGEVRFNSRVDGILIEEEDGIKRAVGVTTEGGETIRGKVILATGHSARDTIRKLYKQGVSMEPKGFAMGVRLEHPVQIIDRIQYHSPEGRGEYLPAAEYNFVTQINGRGVYSFCMCPGGVVVPAMSAEGESVVNGMSSSARNGKWSNSGMVVEIRPGDFPEYSDRGVFELMDLQEDTEKRFFRGANGTMMAPAQRMYDFVNGRQSGTLPKSSYAPGLLCSRVDRLLPPFVSERLKEGFKDFGRKSKGFLTNEAVVIGLESRTSSPIRIPRDGKTLCHTEIKDLYPAGEGAGYAGGIISAAVDGRRIVDAIAETRIFS